MKPLNKVIITISVIIIIAFLVVISIPKNYAYTTNDATFIYNNNTLEIIKNNQNLNKQEQSKIADVNKDLKNTSVVMETNHTFSNFTSENNVDEVLAKSVELCEGYVLNVDDYKFYIVDENVAKDAILDIIRNVFPTSESFNNYLNSGRIDNINVNGKIFSGFNLKNNISLKKDFIPKDQIITNFQDLEFKLNNKDQNKEEVEINNGDTIDSILKSHDLTNEQFNLNNNIVHNQLLIAGTKVIVNKPDPILILETKYQYTNTEPLPYQKVNEQTESLKIGEQQLKQHGVDGVQNITYEESFINGISQNTTPIKYDITVPSIDEITLVGIKEVSGYGTGTLRWPSSSCRITNGYGGADLAGFGHLAIDIQSGYGSSIYAADNGRVIFSGWDPYGGGNTVRIDHGNGMVTQYCHMMSPSSLRVGQNVEKGQVIGYEGASGLATGPHLHFEVIVNGVRRNPLGYVSC